MAESGLLKKIKENRVVDWAAYQYPNLNFIKHKSASDGLTLYNYRWISSFNKRPKAVICFLPGYGTYAGKYANIAKMYADQGYDFIGMDYKGYGRSEGQRRLIKNLDLLYEEELEFLLKAREFYKQLYPETAIPFYTFGYSLGCKISIGVARKLKESGSDPLDG